LASPGRCQQGARRQSAGGFGLGGQPLGDRLHLLGSVGGVGEDHGGALVAGIAREGGARLLHRPAGIAQGLKELSQLGPPLGLLGVELDAAPQRREGAQGAALQEEDVADQPDRGGVFGADAQSVLQLDLRLFQLALIDVALGGGDEGGLLFLRRGAAGDQEEGGEIQRKAPGAARRGFGRGEHGRFGSLKEKRGAATQALANARGRRSLRQRRKRTRKKGTSERAKK